MTYFITGGTGFIGRNLIERLARRPGTIHCLVRAESVGKLAAIGRRYGLQEDRLIPVIGDLTLPNLGVDAATIEGLAGQVDHLFHLAAVYDITADPERQRIANVDGTRRMLDLAEAIQAGTVHHISSIAAAGTYRGTFTEDMLEEATGLSDPYYRTKHESEKLVRSDCTRPWRIYRPGIVLGDSRTGEMDKVDGPAYAFGLLKRLRHSLPGWFPLIGIEGRRPNLVPVDFVADALDHIAHTPDRDGQTFHLTDPNPQTAGRVLNTFAKAAGAPRFGIRIDPGVFDLVPNTVTLGLMALAPVRRIVQAITDSTGIPRQFFTYVSNPTTFDSTNTQAALEGTDIDVPAVYSYADKVWDYWARNLDPALFEDRSLAGAVADKRIMITGASSGIGRAAAQQIGAAGGTVLLVARSTENLEATKADVEAAGGTAFVHPCDLTDDDDVARLVEEVLSTHGGVDILVNNAGRSIRRGLAMSYDRLHDFQRTMQLNYFGALRLILGFLPGMRERQFGHIINVSSIGVQTNVPRFSAYVASKSALDAFSRCAGTEIIDDNCHVTTIYMPLVRTEMITPTKMYDAFPASTPETAGGLICRAIIDRPKRIATGLGNAAQVGQALAPKLMDAILNTGYHLFPDSRAARNGSSEVATDEDEASSEGLAFAHLLRGIHW
ncbi:SDR family oxidoreductase [Euzebya tangerina]|uniref:SDR family oxidoreductase n=1 Tax=Euzebya tangerina TaxID=591198 RepID=UPI000E30FC64|nr:SDR family oxidoreductase [Euzebya tangerina]